MTEPTTNTGDDRLDRFDAALEQIGHRASAHDRRWALLGLLAMAAGILVTIAAYVTSTNQAATGDVIEAVVLGLVGVCVVVAGAAVFVRFSLTEFLRFWMLRMLLQESGTTTSKDR